MRTVWTQRGVHDVKRDVRQYASWSSLGPEYALNGIYYDESTWHEGAVMHYAELAAFARTLRWDAWKALPAQASSSARSDIVALNPGCNVHEDYFQFADHIVVHEQTVQSWMCVVAAKIHPAHAYPLFPQARQSPQPAVLAPQHSLAQVRATAARRAT